MLVCLTSYHVIDSSDKILTSRFLLQEPSLRQTLRWFRCIGSDDPLHGLTMVCRAPKSRVQTVLYTGGASRRNPKISPPLDASTTLNGPVTMSCQLQELMQCNASLPHPQVDSRAYLQSALGKGL